MLWWIVAALGLAFVILKFPALKIALLHPLLDFFYFCRDLYYYILHKEYNNCPTGEMMCFEGLFGRGKTLSAVHHVCDLYRRYNNRPVWDKEKKKFVKQYVHIISNVDIKHVDHYEQLDNLSQIVQNAYRNKDLDREMETKTVLLVLIDEASVQLNSRSFKTNINADFLNTLLTSRHYHMSMFYTSQRFSLTDKLLRDVTQTVVHCGKVWRLMAQSFYDGYELENAGNPELVQPRSRGGFFVRNRDYEAYDTLAVVEKLQKSFDQSDFVSDQEILALRDPSRFSSSDADGQKSGLFRKIFRA